MKLPPFPSWVNRKYAINSIQNIPSGETKIKNKSHHHCFSLCVTRPIVTPILEIDFNQTGGEESPFSSPNPTCPVWHFTYAIRETALRGLYCLLHETIVLEFSIKNKERRQQRQNLGQMKAIFTWNAEYNLVASQGYFFRMELLV